MNETSPPKPLSFPQLAGIIFGVYCAANLLIMFLVLAHAIGAPIDVLFCLTFVGPPGLAFVLLALWSDTTRPERSGIVLAVLLAGAAGIATLNFLCFAVAVASV